MIQEYTKMAICALLRVDGKATDAEIERVKDAMMGRTRPSRIIRVKDAACALGIDPRTVSAMAAVGRLQGVRSRGKRLIGVTEDSISNIK